MKASRLIFTPLLASRVAVVQLVAQQIKADQRPIEDVKKKAEAGDAESQVELGLRYDTGKGMPKDQVEAASWYRKAAEQNYPAAQYILALCFQSGDGVAKDWVEAYKWLLLAMKEGYGHAKNDMTELESKLAQEQIADGQKRARAFKPR